MPVSMTNIIASTALSAAVQTAPVVSVEPLVVNEPVMVQTQHCTDVVRSYDNGDRSVLGGIIGGVIGSQIGHDQNTRRIMTGVGAILGTQAASDYNRNPSVRYSTHCAPSYTQQVVPTIKGYKVTYIIDGIQQTSIMSYNPGQFVTVNRSYSIQ